MRLQVLLVTGSVVVTVLRLFLLNSVVRREATAIMTGVAAGLHVFALLAPSVWLFYQWQWNGLFLLQWQGAVFLFCLFALPVSTFCFS
ncbi:multidrug transporter [Salmonella enterica]|uniref:Multidrug transporter n=1 Tax=Salmonella enterica TaxID=28901 RepID=A0A5T3RAY9_SALER|nr:multidrug transporter [Salmonella enterica]